MTDEVRGTGVLYLCATPIGNLEDITLRALNGLRGVDYIAAEDTRRTIKLLNHYAIKVPLISYHEHNRQERGEYLVGLLRQGKNIALVSDAGTPGISDPGYELVCLAVENQITVTPLPGPAAFVAALVVSGLPTDRFVFEGFLPRRTRDRQQALAALESEPRTLIFYEAPHRLRQTLAELEARLGSRRVAVAREITKKFEEIIRGTLPEVRERFGVVEPRGEFTIVLAGASAGPVAENSTDAGLTTTERVDRLVREGVSKKAAIKQVAKERGLPKREVYTAAMGLKKEESERRESD